MSKKRKKKFLFIFVGENLLWSTFYSDHVYCISDDELFDTALNVKDPLILIRVREKREG